MNTLLWVAQWWGILLWYIICSVYNLTPDIYIRDGRCTHHYNTRISSVYMMG